MVQLYLQKSLVFQQFFFYNVLTYIINILLFGTFFTYLIYIYIFKNKQQNIGKNDFGYNLIKVFLVLLLAVSFLFFLNFILYFYAFFGINNNYSIVNYYSLIPHTHINFYYQWFEFSVDFFGIILLFLGYFVGILSLLALDNRIF